MKIKIYTHAYSNYIIAISKDQRFIDTYGKFYNINYYRRYAELNEIKNWAEKNYNETVKFEFV